MKSNECEAWIYGLKKEVMTVSGIKQGIKRKDQYKYNRSKFYRGSNGSYAYGHQSYRPKLLLTVVIADYYGVGKHEVLEQDIYDYVLQQNHCERLSGKLLEYIRCANIGKKILVIYNSELQFDLSQVDVVPDYL